MTKRFQYVHDYDLTNDGFASSIPYLVQFCVAVTACIAVGILTEKNLIVLVQMSLLVFFSPQNRKIRRQFEPFMLKSFKNSKILWVRWTHARLFVIVPHQCCWMQYSSCCGLFDNIIWFYGTLWRCIMNDFKSLGQSEKSVHKKSVIMRDEIENSSKLCGSSATICWPLRYPPVMCWIYYSGMVTSIEF